MQLRKLILSLVPILSLLIVSCGGHSTSAPQTPDYSALDGNWRLLGQSSSPVFPPQDNYYIGVAIDVVGNTIYARGEVFASCSQGSSSIGSSISATSPIAADGSFLLTDSMFPLNTLQYTIRGNVPPSGASTWQGSYTLFNSLSSTGCTISESGTFSATAYVPFHGTYTGTLNELGSGTGMSVAFQVAQGAPTVAYVGPQNLPDMYIPLTGAVTVTGSPCFTSGAIVNGTDSLLFGDSFLVWVSMNDRYTLQLSGKFANPSEATLQPFVGLVQNGQCANTIFNGKLTLQP